MAFTPEQRRDWTERFIPISERATIAHLRALINMHGCQADVDAFNALMDARLELEANYHAATRDSPD